MKRFVLCLVALMLPVAAVAVVDGNANINVYLSPPSYDGCDDVHFGLIEAGICEDFVSVPIPGQSFLWVYMSDGDMYPDGVGGIQFGIEHDKQMGPWSLCTGGSEVPEAGWPNSGTGNAMTWAGGCYNPAGENAVVGFFSLSDGSVGSIAITGDPRIGVALWADCVPFSQDFNPELLGGLDNSTGGDPNCDEGGTPTLESSWGQIKANY